MAIVRFVSDPTGSTARHTTYVRMGEVRPAERNPRIHGDRQVRSLAQFMTRVGFTSPCIVDERTARMVAGHGRLDALGYLRSIGAGPPEGILIDDDGEWLVPLTRGWASRDDAEAEAVVVFDNKANEMGGWHFQTLASMLEDLQATDVDLFERLDYDADELDPILQYAGDDVLAGQAPGTSDVEHALSASAADLVDKVPPAASEDLELLGDGSTGGPGESSGKKQVRCPSCGDRFTPGDRF